MLARTRCWMLPLVALLAVAPLTACSKRKAPSAEAKVEAKAHANPEVIKRKSEVARKMLDELKGPLGELSAKYAALQKEFDQLPPDLPDFGDSRGRFYSASVSFGAMSSSVGVYAERLDAAVSSQNEAELDLVTKDIAHLHEGLRQADRIATQLGADVKPFQEKLAELRQKAAEARSKGQLSCE